MENIEIPDDFYMVQRGTTLYIAHNSCRYNGNSWSNSRCTLFYYNNASHCIDTLRDICDIYDILNEKTYFKENKCGDLSVFVSHKKCMSMYDLKDRYKYIDKYFRSIDELLKHLEEEYLECIRSDDIKIALKN